MNKTISINISGLVFNVEDLAFEKLKQYLDAIKSYFKNEQGGNEIIADIETRIAELFQELLSEDKTVITTTDVERIIANLGQPQEMLEEEDLENDKTYSQHQSSFSHSTEREKKIFRDPDEKVVGGVCAGLSHYLGLDTIWVRLIFILITLLLPGTGILIYAILWTIAPEALTTADKLKMKGKPVNVSNIEESIKKGVQNIGDDLSDFVNDPKNKNRIRKGTNQITSFIQLIVNIIGVIFKVVLKIIAIALIIAAIAAIISLTIAFFSSFGIFGFVFHDLVTVVFPGPWHATLLLITILLVVAVPLIIILIRAFQLLLKQGSIPKPIMLTSFIVWIVCVIGLFAQAMFFAIDNKSQANIDEEIVLNNPDISRYYIETKNSQVYNGSTRHYGINHWSDDEFYFEDNRFFFKDITFRVEPSKDGSFHLIKRTHSKGPDYNGAIENAQLVEYNLEQNDSIIYLSPYLGLYQSPFRFQNVTLILQVPREKEIMFLNSTYDIKYHVAGHTNYYYDYPNKVFKMTSNGLKYVAGVSKSEVENGMLNYSYSGFDEIVIKSEEPIRVEIIEGNNYKVLINEEFSSKKRLEFRTHSDELTIEVDETGETMGDIPVHIIIEVPSLREFTCSGVGEYIVRTEKSSGVIELNYEGTTSGAFIGHIDNLYLDIAGNSEVQLNGSVKNLNCDIAGSSKLSAYEMLAEQIDIDLAGICSAELFATTSLRIDAAGSCKVTYKGNPTLSKNIAGLAIVEKID